MYAKKLTPTRKFKPTISPSALDVGNNIRTWRMLKNYSQKNFAKRLTIISVAALSKIENGKINISLLRLC